MNKNIDHFIIGTGFLASKFKRYHDFLKRNNTVVYAAGISNSLEVNKKKLHREIVKIDNFLKKNQKKIIYISTYSVTDSSRSKKQYVKNKIKIEKLIIKKSKDYLIIRMPEIIGNSKNPNTLTNFFYERVLKMKKFILFKNSRRNLLEVNDAIINTIKIIKLYKNKNKIVNLLNKKFYTPLMIVKTFENILNKKANFKFSNLKKGKWTLKENFFVSPKKNYLKKVLKIYYT